MDMQEWQTHQVQPFDGDAGFLEIVAPVVTDHELHGAAVGASAPRRRPLPLRPIGVHRAIRRSRKIHLIVDDLHTHERVAEKKVKIA